MSKWMIYAKKADFEGIARTCGISPFLARIIRNRDVIGAEETQRFLTGTLRDIPSPRLLSDMDRAAELLYERMGGGHKIRVIGDYDVDGITSSYILWRVLTFLGADVSVRLPDRIADGYGINIRLVDEAIADGVDTILTCDNGISAVEPLRHAKDQGLTVIVTDHHEIPLDAEGREILPPADAIVEPGRVNQETGERYYPFREICGAQVAYKLACVLLDEPDISGPGESGQTPQQRLLRELLVFAALGCVCDVMPLIGENRILVRAGLAEAGHTENIGLAALILSVGLGDVPLTTYHAGFVIGPCLNAAGRLGSAEQALRLFMESDFDEAMRQADALRELNDSRKQMTEEGVVRACAAVDAMLNRDGNAANRILVVTVPDCHESLAGIIAGRLREQYGRPAIVLTDAAGDPASYKGSGRSVDAYDMYTAMAAYKDLYTKFGGHRQAAGLTLPRENAEALRRALNESCTLTAEELVNILHIDMELPMRYVSMDLVREIERLAPFGTQNPKPLFAARDMELTLRRILGKNRNVLRLSARDADGSVFDCVYFARAGQVPAVLADSGTHRAHVVYRPEINSWQGRESLQFVIEDYRLL